jgi:hypothetical protein
MTTLSVGDTVLHQGIERVVLETITTTRGGSNGDPKFYSREDVYLLVGSSEKFREEDLTYIHRFSTVPLVSKILNLRQPTREGPPGRVELEYPVSDIHPDGLLLALIDTTNNAAMWSRCVELLGHQVKVWCEPVNLPGLHPLAKVRTIVKIENLEI